MEIDINKITKNELLDLENFIPKETFTEIIIVPTNNIHDSGYRCMKYVLMKGNKVVGVVGGYSDVVHINGIGGYGLEFNPPHRKGYGWRIDCLKKSKCIRLFSDEKLTTDYIGTSDFIFYVNERKK